MTNLSLKSMPMDYRIKWELAKIVLPDIKYHDIAHDVYNRSIIMRRIEMKYQEALEQDEALIRSILNELHTALKYM